MRSSSTLWTVAAVCVASVGLSACGLFGSQPEPIVITNAVYQPYAATYRGLSVGKTTQYFDQQPTETDFGFEYFVSTDLAAATEGLTAAFVLDSVHLVAGASGGVSQAEVDSTRGVAFTASMTPGGRLSDFVGGEYFGGLASEIADRVLKQFFPVLPEQGAEAGASWSDTVETQMAVNGLDNHIQMISDHSATDWTLFSGVRALHIVTVSSYSFSGIGNQAGRDFTLDGNGRRHLHRYVSESGRYLGMVSADTSEGEARITDIEMVIPIHQTRTDSLLIR